MLALQRPSRGGVRDWAQRDIEVALKVQLLRLIHRWPEALHLEWGGTVGGHALVQRPEAWDDFHTFWQQHGSTQDRFLHRVDPAGLWAPGNVVFRDVPASARWWDPYMRVKHTAVPLLHAARVLEVDPTALARGLLSLRPSSEVAVELLRASRGLKVVDGK